MSLQVSDESLFAEEKIESTHTLDENYSTEEEENIQSMSYTKIETEDKDDYIQESLTEIMNKSQNNSLSNNNKKQSHNSIDSIENIDDEKDSFNDEEIDNIENEIKDNIKDGIYIFIYNIIL